MAPSLTSYCQGFARAGEPWPPLPLEELPELLWWRGLIDSSAEGELTGFSLLNALEAALPQLHLPQEQGISTSELYKALVLREEGAQVSEVSKRRSSEKTIPSWQEPEALRLWIAPHPCGAMPVLETPSRVDFVRMVRALAHRGEPVAIADGVHAQAISGLIHWGLINQFGRQSRARLILLHQAPYGSVSASELPSEVGELGDEAWLAASSKQRVEHELTHLATKRLLGEMRLNLLDELIADSMGMVAALGGFSAELFGRCLGTTKAGGRWNAYTIGLNAAEAQQALDLVMTRADELEQHLRAQPELQESIQAMYRLQWLTRQKLDQRVLRLSKTSEIQELVTNLRSSTRKPGQHQ